MLRNTSYSKLDSTLKDFYEKSILKNKCDALTNLVSDSPTLESGLMISDFKIPIRTLKEKILLGIIHWYFPVEIRFTVNLWLEENWGADFEEVKFIILTSKELALGYLLVQEKMDEHQFYGNFLTNENLLKIYQLSFKRKDKRKVVKPEFRRGYRDKGSMRLPHISTKYDYRKLLSVETLLEREILLNKKVESLLDKIFSNCPNIKRRRIR